MDPVIHHAVQEGFRLDALAHQAALHVGQGHDHGVHDPVADQLPQFLQLARNCLARAAGAVLVAHRFLPVPVGRC